MSSEFEKYAVKHCGISSLRLHDFRSVISDYVSPTIIEERQLNVATMDVFSRLMMDRIIFLGGADLRRCGQHHPGRSCSSWNRPIRRRTSSSTSIRRADRFRPVWASTTTMQLVNCDVATICTGLAASMGAVLLTAGTAGKRSALPHSRVMIHQPLGGAQGQASDIEITAREILRTKRELYEILASHAGVPIKKIEKDADRDYWMTADEAKNYGLIDEVLKKRK